MNNIKKIIKCIRTELYVLKTKIIHGQNAIIAEGAMLINCVIKGGKKNILLLERIVGLVIVRLY